MEKIKQIIKYVEREFEVVALVGLISAIVLVGFLGHCTTRPLDFADKVLLQRIDERLGEIDGLSK